MLPKLPTWRQHDQHEKPVALDIDVANAPLTLCPGLGPQRRHAKKLYLKTQVADLL